LRWALPTRCVAQAAHKKTRLRDAVEATRHANGRRRRISATVHCIGGVFHGVTSVILRFGVWVSNAILRFFWLSSPAAFRQFHVCLSRQFVSTATPDEFTQRKGSALCLAFKRSPPIGRLRDGSCFCFAHCFLSFGRLVGNGGPEGPPVRLAYSASRIRVTCSP